MRGLAWWAASLALSTSPLAADPGASGQPLDLATSPSAETFSATAANSGLDLGGLGTGDDAPFASNVTASNVAADAQAGKDEVRPAPSATSTVEKHEAGTVIPPPDRRIQRPHRATPTTGSAAAGAERRELSAGGARLPWYRGPYLALAAVLALIAVLSWAFKRWVPAARPLGARALRVVGRIPLSAKQSAVLLHVGRRLVLIGVSAERAQTLSEITDPEEVSLLLGQLGGPAMPAEPDFTASLSREFERYVRPGIDVAAGGAGPDTPPGDDLLQETRGRLHGLMTRLRRLQAG